MNYYKNTRPKGAIYDTHGFFAIEQISSTFSIVLAGLIFFYFVNKPAVPLYEPKSLDGYSITSVEKENLLKSVSSAQTLLKEDSGKFTEEQIPEMENSINQAITILDNKKAGKDDIENAIKSIDKTAGEVKNTFAYKFTEAIKKPTDKWFITILSGPPFGAAAFFSVFLFS